MTKNSTLDTDSGRGNQTTDTFCKVCGKAFVSTDNIATRDRILGARGIFTIRLCRSCGSGSLSSNAGVPEREDLYPEDYYSYVSGFDGLPAQIRRAIISKRLNANLSVKSELAKIIAALMPAEFVRGIPTGVRTLLDVGCGSGSGVRDLVDAGIEVWGVDVQANATKFARSLGIHTILGEYPKVDLPESYFDAVRMWHSLEHLLDPGEALSKAWHVLKDHGLLLIGTPDIQSLTSRIFGPNWYHLDSPRHTVLFSAKGLRQAIVRAGFCPLSESHWSDRGFLASLLFSMFSTRGSRDFPLTLIDSPFLAAAFFPVDLLVTNVSTGDHVYLICKKVGSGST